ncbi:MAG TPA: amino acid adenylation domain-containing protein [Thermoanaerobaculia bacterium]|nr:amino acid adenylation domain-containing protein [Thermoanaerobaculia bacterium]
MPETPQQRLAALSPEQRALLLQRLADQKAAKAKVSRRARPEVIPPSFAQQRLWLLDQLEPGTASYNIPAAAWLTGRVDPDVLRRCLDELVRRHEALRTILGAIEGTPRQVIGEPFPVALPLYEAAGREAALAIANKEAALGFDLARGPLLRALLIRSAAEEHLLVINFHHVIIDGWSLSIFFRELAALYEAFLEGQPSPLGEPPLQYADYALWQREWMQGETLQGQLDYWKERLAGTPPVLELPTDHPRPAVQSHRGGVVRVSIPTEVVAAAHKRSREEGVTLFMTFLAALQTVLFRYSGQTDIIIGSGIAGRNREELETIVGYFVNTLPLRADLSGNPTFRELLGRVRNTTLDAYAHQDLPVERVIEELHVERSLSHNPLFQVMVFFQNHPEQAMQLSGATLVQTRMDELNSATARCDLSLFVDVEEKGIEMLLEYSTDLFEPGTVRAFGEHVTTLLNAAVAHPETSIADLPMLSEGERHELLVTRTANRVELPQVPLTRVIEEQTARTPDAPAIVFEGRVLSYHELDLRANAFAHLLRERGAKPGMLIGIFTDRGVEMIVAVLGILKSGAAYLPLDPSYPADRIAFMIEDSGARMVVTQEHLRNEVPSAHAELVILDCTGPVPEATEAIAPARPSDVAYVIFTSGSTGKPKGVQIPHAGALNFLLAFQREPGLTAADTVCAITTLSFDISVLELLLPLITGAKAVIGDRATAVDGKRLARFIADSGSTLVQATPASWRMLLDAGWTGDPKLKLLCGGEPMPRDLADALLDRCGELWNVYGPTETTVWSVLDRIERGTPITIGRPIQNMRMYIADANMQLCPDGVPGELFIGGIGLGHAYVNRPAMTADRFIADPFSGEPGARLYRSGDIARWRRDGRLEILGRADNQIKLRGFRIELGEIEGTLREHAGVRHGVVICREDRPGDKRLVAYVVPETAEVGVADLRGHLKAALPEYMVPSAFVLMEKLPISPNGKVDRKALPAPELSDMNVETSAPPRTTEEQELAAIWSEILGIGQIGIHDDFFALGGHSLLATQLIARVSREFGIDIPLRRLFEAPTIAAFARVIEADLLARVDSLSDEELEALLAAEGQV